MKRRMPGARAQSPRRGVIAVLVAISLTALIGVLALAIDGGRLFDQHQRAQATADAAAMAAAVELFNRYEQDGGRDPKGIARNMALTVAAANGVGNDGKSSIVTVNIPPSGGTYAGKAGYVEVRVQVFPTRGFSSIFGGQAASVTGRATTGGTYEPTLASVVVLEPSKKNALQLKGSTSLSVAGNLYVNSKNKNAIKADKKSAINAENVMVAGNIPKNSRQFLRASEQIYTGAKPTPDPLADLPNPPKTKELNLDDYIVQKTSKDSAVYHLEPGTYKGPLKFDHDDEVTMAPGVYYIDGGGFSLKKNASLSAHNVMIFNSGKKEMKFQSTGNVELTPPSSGTYAGISLFQSRTSKGRISFKKDTDFNVSGIIYAPTGEVRFQNSDIDITDVPDDDDDEWLDDDGIDGGSTVGSLGAAIISKSLKIDKKSHIDIRGNGIAAEIPVLGILE